MFVLLSQALLGLEVWPRHCGCSGGELLLAESLRHLWLLFDACLEQVKLPNLEGSNNAHVW